MELILFAMVCLISFTVIQLVYYNVTGKRPKLSKNTKRRAKQEAVWDERDRIFAEKKEKREARKAGKK